MQVGDAAGGVLHPSLADGSPAGSSSSSSQLRCCLQDPRLLLTLRNKVHRSSLHKVPKEARRTTGHADGFTYYPAKAS